MRYKAVLIIALGVVVLVLSHSLGSPSERAQVDGVRLQSVNAAHAEATRVAVVTEPLAELEIARAEVEGQLVWVAPVSTALVIFFGGVAVVILAVGVSRALVTWARKRATTIYPNSGGQFPLVQLKGDGWQVVIDPNRSPGHLNMIKSPSLVARLKGSDHLPKIETDMPLMLSEAAHVQTAAQASMVGMVAAVTRYPHQMKGNINETILSASQSLTAPLPTVKRIDPAHVEQLLELSKGEVIDV